MRKIKTNKVSKRTKKRRLPIKDKNLDDRKGYIRYFFKFLKPYRKKFLVVYFLYFLNSVLNLIPAFSIRYYIDLMLVNKNVSIFGILIHSMSKLPLTLKIHYTIFFLIGITVLIIIANTVGIVMWRTGTKVLEKVIYDIKIKIHNHINKLSLGYFYSERVGTIMTKAVGDVQNINLLIRQSFDLTYSFFQILLAPIIMISMSPLLFLVVLVPLPTLIYSFYNLKVKLKPMYRKQRENQSIINSQIQEVISGIREIKAFNMESKARQNYKNINWLFYLWQNRIMRVFSFNHQLQYGSKDFGMVLIAVLGGLFVFYGVGSVTVGTITSFIVLVGFIYNPLNRFLFFYDVIQRGMVSLERIVDFLNIVPDVKDRRNALVLEKIKGNVTYENVTFGYSKYHPVLKDINLEVKKGEKIAIVGPTGSGKSTFISLLLRFYDVQNGRILIDGYNIVDIKQSSLRKHIGIVFQDTFLFYGTVRDNLLFPNPGKTEEEMIKACKAANIYDDIMKLPNGFDTMVGERGVQLSGGQRQRIAIARVFLKNPAIIVLDEATSSVDTITEKLIQESIERMLKNKTAFIIAHRLSTVQKCDKIVVLYNKRIAEIGTHKELLKKKGLYYQMYKKGFEL